MNKCDNCENAIWSGCGMGNPNEVIGCKCAPYCQYRERSNPYKGWK